MKNIIVKIVRLIIRKMKFKYNFWEKKLWRIENNYLYEISPTHRFIKVIPYCGVKIGFDLGQDHYLFLSSNEEPSTSLTVCYIKFLEKDNSIHYEK